jgi:hypothetical protein
VDGRGGKSKTEVGKDELETSCQAGNGTIEKGKDCKGRQEILGKTDPGASGTNFPSVASAG